jgi:phosphohistidine phosphatase SixA
MALVERLVLLRHACAGEKIADTARDFDRGLDAAGEEIAARLSETVTTHLWPNEILSSPFRRCVQTVRPLATTLGLRIREDERLTPHRTRGRLHQTFVQLPADTVVCTHGEVIERLFDGAVTCAKGAFWIVERHDEGRLVPAFYVEAP